jgi:hypothetical protein
MTICDTPCAVNTQLHQTSFPANTKAGFQFLEIILSAGTFFKTKTLWKLRLQKELPLLRRQQLPVTTVKLLQFGDSPERSSSTSKVASRRAYPEDLQNLPQPYAKGVRM